MDIDLIYMSEKKRDIGVLQDYSFDLAYGSDENNFEVKLNLNNHCCKPGYILYIEGTEYGGIIDRLRVETRSSELVYLGRTWHGVLEGKVICPDSGKSHLVLSGDANAVLQELIDRIGLGDLFQASSAISGITILNYQMDRYITGYTGIQKMLKSVGARLSISFAKGFAILSAGKIIDYSKDDEFDADQIDFTVEKDYRPVNHMVCLGQGELTERQVLHLYADSNKVISKTQTFFGTDEVTDIYENTNAADLEELEEGGRKALTEGMNTDELEVSLDPSQTYEIGDIVGARETTTGLFVSRSIGKKIVSIKKEITKIEYKVGDE